jgi:D-alanyl-lipoteichoic acid acyltransferase DltB (MBOAT superfamily)
MLFNSYEFLFLFLPITLLGFHLIGKQGNHRIAIAWLVGASLFFYGWWNPAYLGLLLFSIIFNYSIGVSLGSTSGGDLSKKIVLIFGVMVNLSVLGYFKYANFFIDNLNALTEANIILNEIILPLGISFFTFQQITYLVDTYYQETKEYNFLHYCLFVTFFPQLIAGPIVHHKEILPQFAKDALYKLRSKNLAIGLTIFTLGLFKKVILADGISIYATPVFSAAEAGTAITLFEAWSGSLAYTFQLYFDFSGYSDMALGLARMFGIRLPLNFNSPYKATNISEFWKRWHMTLSRLIRDYLWDPVSLSLTRYALNKKYNSVNIFILTVIIPIIFSFFWIGLWHGAGWNFILFGLLHGAYIVIYSIWVKVKSNHQWVLIIKSKKISRTIGWLVMFISVVFAWVLFRASSIDGALNIYNGMLGLNGVLLPASYLEQFNHYLANFGNYLLSQGVIFKNSELFQGTRVILSISFLLLIAITMPNTQQFVINYNPTIKSDNELIVMNKLIKVQWRPTLFWSLYISTLFIISIFYLSENSEFLYFQF